MKYSKNTARKRLVYIIGITNLRQNFPLTPLFMAVYMNIFN